MQENNEEWESLLQRKARQEELARDIFTAGGVDDLDALKRRLALQGRREDLQSQVDEAERQLEAMFGVQAEETRAALKERDPLAWSDKVADLTSQVGALGEGLNGEDGLRTKRGRKKAEREELEQASDLARHLTEAEMLRQDLRKEMRRWVVLKISRRIIAETLREHRHRTKCPRCSAMLARAWN